MKLIKQYKMKSYTHRLTYYDTKGRKVKHSCSICGKVVTEIILVRDYEGIPFKYVCSEKCVTEARKMLRPYVKPEDDY